MKWSAMPSRDRRAVVWGGIVLLLPLLYIWAVRPYRAALSGARDELAAERAALARERAAIATARENPQLQRVADSAMRAMRPRLFEGKDDVMASAELASYLGEVAANSRVWLQDASTRPAVAIADGVRSLRVDIRGESDLRGVLRFLRALESGAKLVRVERLDLARGARGEEGEVETLSVTATISGFAVADGETPAATGPAAAPRAANGAQP